MSAELSRNSAVIDTLASEAGRLAGRSLLADGVPGQEAFTRGAKGGNIAAQILLSALQEVGALEIDALDLPSLKDAMRQQEIESGVAAEVERRRFEVGRLFSVPDPE